MPRPSRDWARRSTIVEFADQILSNDDKDMADGVRASARRRRRLLLRFPGRGRTQTPARKRGRFHARRPDADRPGRSAPRGHGRKRTWTAWASKTSALPAGKGPHSRREAADHATPHIRGGRRHRRLPVYPCGRLRGRHRREQRDIHVPRKARYTLMPWVTYTDPELACIGMNEKAAAAAGIHYTVWSGRSSITTEVSLKVRQPER